MPMKILNNMWGVSFHSQIYNRPTDDSGNWLHISGMYGMVHDYVDLHVCFSDVSESNSGYAWDISRQN
jgi:hypothetical protein